MLLLECKESAQSLLSSDAANTGLHRIKGTIQAPIEALLSSLYEACQSEAQSGRPLSALTYRKQPFDKAVAPVSLATTIKADCFSHSASDQALHSHVRNPYQQSWPKGRFTQQSSVTPFTEEGSRQQLESKSLQPCLKPKLRSLNASQVASAHLKGKVSLKPARGRAGTLKKNDAAITAVPQELEKPVGRRSAPAAFPVRAKRVRQSAETQQAGISREPGSGPRLRKSLDDMFYAWHNSCISPQAALPIVSIADLQRSSKVQIQSMLLKAIRSSVLV